MLRERNQLPDAEHQSGELDENVVAPTLLEFRIGKNSDYNFV
jgi:hypothetical protein